MGSSQSTPVSSGVFIGEGKEGETPEMYNAYNKALGPEPSDKDTMLTALQNIQIHLSLAHEKDCVSFPALLGFIANGTYGKYRWRTYKDTMAMAKKLAHSIEGMKLAQTIPYDGKTIKTIGIYSKNREEWLITDIACWFVSVTNVPLYDTLGEESISWIFEQTELATVFTTSQGISKLLAMKTKNLLPTLKYMVTYEEVEPALYASAKEVGIEVIPFKKLLEASTSDTPLTPAKPEDLITICYTSGTTAKAKGVEITQRGFHADAWGCVHSGSVPLGHDNALFSYLPLAHVFERVCCYIGFQVGYRIAFYQGDITKLAEDIAIAKPTILVGVPRVFGRFYDTIMSGINKTTGFKRKLVNKAIESKTEAFRKSGAITHWFYDKFVLSKVRNALGGNTRVIVSAAAPIEPSVTEFFRIMFSCNFVQGYGQTETAGAISLSHPLDIQRGSVGPPLPCSKIKLVDVPEMNYKTTDVIDGIKMPRGELCIKGLNVTRRYFKDTEKTNEVIDEEGWMHTGDIVCLLGNGAIKIVDRRKNIFKLQQGEYIAPEKVENLLVNTKWVMQIFVYGDSMQTYIVAIIVPKKEVVMEWAQSKGLGNKTFEELCEDKELREVILADLTAESKKGKLMGFELIKKIHLTANPFTIENGSLTPTLKIKRNEAKKMYAEAIEKMYAEPLAERKEVKKE